MDVAEAHPDQHPVASSEGAGAAWESFFFFLILSDLFCISQIHVLSNLSLCYPITFQDAQCAMWREVPMSVPLPVLGFWGQLEAAAAPGGREAPHRLLPYGVTYVCTWVSA